LKFTYEDSNIDSEKANPIWQQSYDGFDLENSGKWKWGTA